MSLAHETDDSLFSAFDEPTVEVPSYPPGTILGDTYCLERSLASGGMGEIYLARHTRLPGWFAIKMLQAALTLDSHILERFRREAELMATLRHPHIAQVVDYNVTPDGRPYLVMEYIEGADLAEVARQHGPMVPALAADFVRQTASALAAAHARGIVHLDLKPENVMVVVGDDKTPFVKVIDFGIAKSVHHAPTVAGPLIGTPEYMSPEQAEGRLDLVDGRSDQFSLAVMAFFLLTGHNPWGAEEPMTMLYRICNESPQCLANYVGAPLEQIESVLRTAMAKNPAERYASVTDFARAFDQAVIWDTAAERGATPVESFAPILEESVTLPAVPIVTDQTPALVEEADDIGYRSRGRRRGSLGVTAVAMAAGLVAWLSSGLPFTGGPRPVGTPAGASSSIAEVGLVDGDQAHTLAAAVPGTEPAAELGLAADAMRTLRSAFQRLARP